MPPNETVSLLSDVLEKMIESQIANTEALTHVRSSIDDIEKKIDDNHRMIENIKNQFSNGFRSEIKEAIKKRSDVNEERSEGIQTSINELKNNIKEFKSVGFWAKIIAAFITTLGILVAATIKIVTALTG